MNAPDLQEAVDLTNNVVLAALLSTIQGQNSQTGAQLRQLCGALSANAANLIALVPSGDLTFWVQLAQCLDLAQTMISFALMDTVRAAAEGASPTGAPAIAVQNFSVRMALAEQAKILAATTFKSRQEIDTFFDAINASFNTAEQVAADNMDNIAYVALIKLHAAVSNDLANRARPLPRMTSYVLPRSKSSLSIAQLLYQDGSRSGELIDENRPIHPLFMPRSIRALSQ